MVLWVSAADIRPSAVFYSPYGWGKLWKRLSWSEAGGVLYMEPASLCQGKVEWRMQRKFTSWWTYVTNDHGDFQCVLCV